MSKKDKWEHKKYEHIIKENDYKQRGKVYASLGNSDTGPTHTMKIMTISIRATKRTLGKIMTTTISHTTIHKTTSPIATSQTHQTTKSLRKIKTTQSYLLSS